MKRSYRFVAYVAVTGLFITGLTLVNPNHFTSIDSGYYLQSATNLIRGQGYRFQENDHRVWNGIFPIGYSALIALVSALTGVSVLISSKLVNYLALCFFAGCWLRRLGADGAGWLLSVWWLGGFLKILAYTWSETLFLVLLAEWVWSFHHCLTRPSIRRSGVLFGTSYLLFLTRYIGGYVFGLLGCAGLLIWLFPKQKWSLAGSAPPKKIHSYLLGISGIGVVGMSLYFLINYQLSGSLYGGERLLPTESAADLAFLFGQSLLNEWLLIRDFLPNESNQLAWLGLVIQLVVAGIFYWQFRKKTISIGHLSDFPSLSHAFILTGFAYLLVLFLLRIVSPYAGPNLRLMAPFTFCIVSAGLIWVGTQPIGWQRFSRPYWVFLLLCSWLQLLPQADFNRKLERIWAKLLPESFETRRSNSNQRYRQSLCPHNQPFTSFPAGVELSTPIGTTGLMKKYKSGMAFRSFA